MVVLGPAPHPAVAVAERLDVRDAERGCRHLELAEPDARDVVGVVAVLARLDVPGRVAELAVRARDEHGADALGGVAGERAAGAVRLVVGVRVHRHEGEDAVVCHAASMPHRRASVRGSTTVATVRG